MTQPADKREGGKDEAQVLCCLGTVTSISQDQDSYLKGNHLQRL